MKIKRQLRKAFEAATPDVLGRVMKDCPATRPVRQAEEQPVVPMPRPSRFREFAATAAALALLITVAAGGWMYLRHVGSTNHGTLPIEPVPAVTEPESVPVSDFIRREILRYLGLSDSISLNITAEKRDDVRVYTTRCDGFSYEFVFTAEEQFAGVYVLESNPDSFLPPLVAYQQLYQYLMELLDTTLNDTGWRPHIISNNTMLQHNNRLYYQYRASYNPAMSSIPTFYVDAVTGTVFSELPVLPEVELFDLRTARDAALNAVHVGLEDVQYLQYQISDPVANRDYHICWSIDRPDGSGYQVYQSLDYKIVSTHYFEQTDEPIFDPNIPCPWHEARSIALEDAGVALTDLTAIDCRYSEADAWYLIAFSAGDVDYSYSISSKTGAIFVGGPVGGAGFIPREAALDLVTRQSELPQALKDAVLTGQAEVQCTLILNGPDSVYNVELWWDSDYKSYHCHAQVDAVGGELLNFRVHETTREVAPTETTASNVTLTQQTVAEYTITELFGFTMDESHVLGIKEEPGLFTVRFFAAGCRYEVLVDATTGQRISHTAEDQYDQLAEFNALFGDWDSYYNWALCDLYPGTNRLSLSTLFQNANTEDWLMPAVAWYEDWYNSLPEGQKGLDHNLIPKALMEQVLQAYFGVHLADLPSECYAGLTYIGKIDWYSCVASDSVHVEQFQAVGYEKEVDALRLYYTCEAKDQLFVVTLRANDGNSDVPWQILSNRQHVFFYAASRQ